jgi:hypothetical protein
VGGKAFSRNKGQELGTFRSDFSQAGLSFPLVSSAPSFIGRLSRTVQRNIRSGCEL